MSTLHRPLALVLALAVMMSLGCVSVLAAPEASMPDQVILVDNDQVSMTLTDYDPDGDFGPAFTAKLVNRTDKDVFFDLHDIAVNNVMCDPFWGETVSAGETVMSEIYWTEEDLQAAGVNYIQSVAGELSIWDSDTFDDLYAGAAAWSLDLGETDLPAVEPVVFDNGYEPVDILTGELAMRVVDYDPAGSYEDGPQLIFYLENATGSTVYFSIDDVYVNGTECDPRWGETVRAGTSAYSGCWWWDDDLEEAGIDALETMEFTASVWDDDTYEDLIDPVHVTLDMTGAGGGSVTGPAEEPAKAPAELPADVAALMGTVEGNVYKNDYFGLTFAPPEDWEFYSQEELLEQQGLAAERYEGTEMGEQMKQFMDSESGFSVMMAAKEGGVQNVNALVEKLSGLGKYLSEEDLLTIVERQLGADEDGDLSALGMEGATLSRSSIVFAGEEHESLRVDYVDTSMGVELPMYIQMVFVMGEDHVLQVTMTTVFEDLTADVAAMFTLEK